MSRQLLGQPFDIHTGGVDLIFPHHENEIAQSTAGHDDPLLAQIFAHNAHLLVDGQKMSKSLNNFHTLDTIREKGFSPLAFRLLVLQAHYRTQAHFSWENLMAAQNRLQSYYELAALQHQLNDLMPQSPLNSAALQASRQRLTDALSDDLNTPQALAELSQLAEALALHQLAHADQAAFQDYLQFVDRLLGLNLSQLPAINAEQKQLLAARVSARQQQDWQQSDHLRDQLIEQGIGLRDTPAGVIWFRL